MRLFRKEGSTVQIISFPGEDVEKGDYLKITDSTGRSLIVQVIDTEYANIPGVLEELLRNHNNSYVKGEDVDPFEVANHIAFIQDALLLICKIRATDLEGELVHANPWLPSRTKARIKRLPVDQLLAPNRNGDFIVHLGETTRRKEVNIDIRALDGALNIITGKKGTGKSYVSKLLTLSLVSNGAPVVIFDLNGEYAGLSRDISGEPNHLQDRIMVLTPEENFKVTLGQLNIRVMLSILVNTLHLPGTSAREFKRIWRYLTERNSLTLASLGVAIRDWKCNQHVRDALFSRYYTLINTGLLTDQTDCTSLEKELRKTQLGGAVVINLRDTSTTNRYIVVEYVLGKLVELLVERRLRSIFLFAEEAHLYLRETYWNDIVTRMRHYGAFTTFITNQPDTIQESIYRQADNLFLFNFTSSHDLETISRASRVDSETIKSVARDLPPRHCLVLGRVVNDFPVVAKVRELDVLAMGETRLFFGESRSRSSSQ